MRRALVLLALLALAPSSAAQNADQSELAAGGEPPDPDESVEDVPGIAYGAGVLVVVLIFASVLGWASWRQTRRPPLP